MAGCVSSLAKPAEVSSETALEATDFNLAPSSLDLMPEMTAADGIVAFSLSDLSAPDLSALGSLKVTSRIAGIQNDRDSRVGFVFVDTETGRGIAYNADDEIYGASTFKAPYAAFVCETLVEDGDVTLSAPCRLTASADRGSYYKAGRSYAVQDLIDAAVTWSDNNAFGGLRSNFDARGFDEWAVSLGAEDVKYDASSWFPTYCPRTSAKLWAEIDNYVSSGTETAAWLGGLLGDTEVSFIRNGITGETRETTASGLVASEEASGESAADENAEKKHVLVGESSDGEGGSVEVSSAAEDASADGISAEAGSAAEDAPSKDASLQSDAGAITFMNKAGWSADADPAYNSVSDAGLVTVDGRTYLLCIMTDMRDSDSSRAHFERLARAIFDTRGALDYQWVEQTQEA